jgi:hypothetical protein
MIWSVHSRRIAPIKLSATLFCYGNLVAMGFGVHPNLRQGKFSFLGKGAANAFHNVLNCTNNRTIDWRESKTADPHCAGAAAGPALQHQ